MKGGHDAHELSGQAETPLATRAVQALRKLAGGVRGDPPVAEVRAVLVTTVVQCVVALCLEHRERLGALDAEGAPAVSLSYLAARPELPSGGSWAAAHDLFRVLHHGWSADGVVRVHAVPGGLFAPPASPLDVSDEAFLAALDALGAAGEHALYAAAPVEHLGASHEALLAWDVVRTNAASLVPRAGSSVLDLEDALARPDAERAEVVSNAIGKKLPPTVKRAVCRASSVEQLAVTLRRYACASAPCPAPRDAWVLVASTRRRRSGSHYTSRALADRIVADTLGPLMEAPRPTLRVCDPAMGTGAFLLAAGRWMVRESAGHDDPVARHEAWKHVLGRCLHGVDTDPLAVHIARASLAIEASSPGLPLLDTPGLRHGDALVGLSWCQATDRSDDPLHAGPQVPDAAVADAIVAVHFHAPLKKDRASLIAYVLAHAPRVAAGGRWPEPVRGWIDELEAADGVRPFHWSAEFPEAAAAGGFDAMVGNPPWVAYAGRAAQPLDRARFAWYAWAYEAFRGYRTLHGLFIERASHLLRPGGRLGLIVPTSVADLAGYEPVRAAHDAVCEIDPELPDLGSDSFDGVFQPAMAVLSTRRASPPRRDRAPAGAWTVARTDLDAGAASALERMASWPSVPADTFAERGYQSSKQDTAKFVDAAGRRPGMLPIREGADIAPFLAYAPRLFTDPRELSGRLRSPAQWSEVAVLVRQTARYPIAAGADGVAFRNSILAGFARAPWTRCSLLAYLNSWPLRWLHYMRFRDARQGMPQVKIAHLRTIPTLDESNRKALESLHRLGETLASRNTGIEPGEQAQLDAIVAKAWGLTALESDMISAFAARHPVPLRAARAHA